jgi:ketosteroid isomerase-like protein
LPATAHRSETIEVLEPAILKAMSAENVELVRALYARWARGDFGAAPELLAPEFEWHPPTNAEELAARRGTTIGRSLREIFEVYRDFRIEAEEYIDARDEGVVVVARSRGTARQSGMEFDQMFAYVWTVRNGRLARAQVYGERTEALEAVRLSE